MDERYGQQYRELFENHWWWRARAEVVLGVLRRYRPPGRWSSVLDVGCGDGLLFDRLAEFGDEVEGVEPAAEVISPTNPHRARIHIRPFDRSFRPNKRYSLVLMLDVLEHIRDAAGALRHVATLLDPSGVFLATVPAFNLLWTSHDVLNHHVTRYRKRSFRQLAREAGLRVDHMEYFLHWTYPAKLMVRMKEFFVRTQPSVPRVPSHPVNRALYGISRLERRALGSLPLPFGSSLLVVCTAPTAGASRHNGSRYDGV